MTQYPTSNQTIDPNSTLDLGPNSKAFFTWPVLVQPRDQNSQPQPLIPNYDQTPNSNLDPTCKARFDLIFDPNPKWWPQINLNTEPMLNIEPTLVPNS